MIPNHYIVTLKNGKTVFTTCISEEDAGILAMACMIKNGLTREVSKIIKTTNISDMADTDFIV